MEGLFAEDRLTTSADLDWKPLDSAPRDGTFVELRGDSGMKSYPYRVMIAKYDRDHERRGWTQQFNDPHCWRTVLGDSVTDDGPMPSHWRPAT